MKHNDKIDIVYLWVDGSDKKWRTAKDKWFEIINGKKPIYNGAAGAERFRDNGELLYSFRIDEIMKKLIRVTTATSI